MSSLNLEDVVKLTDNVQTKLIQSLNKSDFDRLYFELLEACRPKPNKETNKQKYKSLFDKLFAIRNNKMNKVNDEVNDELHIENLDENGINNIANMKRKLLDLDDESKKNIDKTPLPDLLPIIRLYKLLYKQIDYNTSEIKSKLNHYHG